MGNLDWEEKINIFLDEIKNKKFNKKIKIENNE